MKRIIVFLSAIVLSFCVLSSCSANQKDSLDSDAYLDGLEQGYKDVFLNLWWAAGPINIVKTDVSWETEHFSLYVSTDETAEGKSVHFELTTHSHTISECFDEQEMLFNVFSYSNGQYDALLTGDLFYMYAQLEYVSENTAHATVRLNDSTDQVALLIAVDGLIYKAEIR